ncbi:MAG: hypothetical protein ACD_85C00009G0004 [uncultured bacterium]|nr:MAG: hypothetical protein ACD_85C00009G0004 [uncultured bacterium]
MQARHLVLSLVSAVGLMGCASYTFKHSDYDYFAHHWVGIQSCSRQGLIDTETASTGVQLLNRRAATATYDKEQLDRAGDIYRKRVFTSEACRTIAVNILSWQKELGQQAASNKEMHNAGKAFSDSMQNARPKQTVCNRLGTQVFCSTY